MDETGKPTELGRAVSARYREIMIDEFQDTNEVQNQIFCGRIPGGKEFVHGGDMKQSIYRFRLADPRFSCATIRQTLCSVRRRRGRSASCCSAVFPLPPGDFGCGQLCMRQPDESGSGGKWLTRKTGPAFSGGVLCRALRLRHGILFGGPSQKRCGSRGKRRGQMR